MFVCFCFVFSFSFFFAVCFVLFVYSAFLVFLLNFVVFWGEIARAERVDARKEWRDEQDWVT